MHFPSASFIIVCPVLFVYVYLVSLGRDSRFRLVGCRFVGYSVWCLGLCCNGLGLVTRHLAALQRGRDGEVFMDGAELNELDMDAGQAKVSLLVSSKAVVGGRHISLR